MSIMIYLSGSGVHESSVAGPVPPDHRHRQPDRSCGRGRSLVPLLQSGTGVLLVCRTHDPGHDWARAPRYAIPVSTSSVGKMSKFFLC